MEEEKPTDPNSDASDEVRLPQGPDIYVGPNGEPLFAVGPGAGLPFVETYFPQASQAIRIASGYFRLGGYDLSRKYILGNVQIRILVGRPEGVHVVEAVESEINRELGQTAIPLHDAVRNLLERIESNQFLIRDAGEAYDPTRRGRFHCKFYICDEALMWSGSANFTYSGLHRSGNDEQVSVSFHQGAIQTHIQYFDRVMARSRNLLEEIAQCLRDWYDMSTPFEAYLKVLHCLLGKSRERLLPGGYEPTYYQEGVIARALGQIRQYRGALLLIATGLGKTVIGAEIIRRITATYDAPLVIILAPRVVEEAWKQQLDSRKLRCHFFDTGTIFRASSEDNMNHVRRLEHYLSLCNEQTLILVDEAHRYRKVLHKDAAVVRRNKKLSQEEQEYNRLKKRFNDATDKGANIVLLTATPYGTSKLDLNGLLSLLPATASSSVAGMPVNDTLFNRESLNPAGKDQGLAWKIRELRYMSSLPVTTVLGMIHVLKMAADRNDVEEEYDGRIYIAMPDGSKSYWPERLMLYRVKFPLYLEDEVDKAFDGKAFSARPVPFDAHNEKEDRNEVAVAKASENNAIRAWLSSPREMARFVRYCRDAPDNPERIPEAQMDMVDMLFAPETLFSERELVITDEGEEKRQAVCAKFTLSKAKRFALLQPLFEKLDAFLASEDKKFILLCEIIQEHRREGRKVIVFVKRLSTAAYLERGLKSEIRDVRVGCTVSLGKGGAGYVLKSQRVRENIVLRFSPRSNALKLNGKIIDESRQFDILLCTDADGIGLDMQDACVIVNYDLTYAADELFQRAGRVLRMTKDRTRTVYVYTFVPEYHGRSTQISTSVKGMVSRVDERHDTSGSLLGGCLLPPEKDAEKPTEVRLATLKDLSALARILTLPEDMLAENPAPIISHAATYDSHIAKASALREVLISAREVSNRQRRIFVLVSYKDNYYRILYNLHTAKMEEVSTEGILDRLRCSVTEEKARVSAKEVEAAALEAINAWHETRGTPEEEKELCVRVCCVLFQPSGSHRDKRTLGGLFDGIE